MLNVFIVDDEPSGIKNLEFLLEQFPDVNIQHKTGDPVDALNRAIQQKPDCVFLDISMPEMSGLAFAERLYEAQSDTRIVFVTAYDNFAIDAYAYNTIDYILKPVTYDKLRRTFRKIEKEQAGSVDRADKEPWVSFMGFRENRYYAIARESAQYIYTSNRRVLLVSEGKEYELKNNIAYWTEQLEPLGWFRCHRNYLINLSQVDMVEPMSNSVYVVSMRNCAQKVVVSRQYSAAFRGMFKM